MFIFYIRTYQIHLMINKVINFSIYLLRYLTIINSKYNVSNKVNFGSKVANNFFKKNLKQCNFYLEYGSGNSTILANKLNKKFKSIETDKSFYRYMKTKKIKNIVYSDLGPTKYYSIPILPIFLLRKKIEKYAYQVEKFYNEYKIIPDFILIDGRFRVFIASTIIKFCLKKKVLNTIIIIDDFKSRKDYHVLNRFFKIKIIGRFGVIKINKKLKLNKKKLEIIINKFK